MVTPGFCGIGVVNCQFAMVWAPLLETIAEELFGDMISTS